MNISIVDDDLVERSEVIKLNLTTPVPDSDIFLLSSIAEIVIVDNDCTYLMYDSSLVLIQSLYIYSGCVSVL